MFGTTWLKKFTPLAIIVIMYFSIRWGIDWAGPGFRNIGGFFVGSTVGIIISCVYVALAEGFGD